MLGRRILAAIVLGVATACVSAHGLENFLATGVRVGTSLDPHVSKFAPFTLDGNNSVATVDYGTEVGGLPWFEISSLSNEGLQIEVKYSETFGALNLEYSDGPYYFVTGLANSFRVETFNVTSTGRLSAFQIQGGQRWQSIRLLSKGSVTISNVGFKASFQSLSYDELPGQFESDDNELNEIWKLGTRAVQAACLATREQPASWRVDSDGILVESQRPAVSHLSTGLQNYALEFDAQILRSGLLWGVGWPVFGVGGGLTISLTGEMPESSSFLNHNYTLLPRNTISLSYKWGLVNQTTLETQRLDSFALPFSVQENKWYRIRTTASSDGQLSVSVNDTLVFNVSIASYPNGPTSVNGGFGFGAWQDCAARFKNAVATDLNNGTVLYSNNLTMPDSVLAEFGVQSNPKGVCLDGPKRDRMMWLGDLYHTMRIVDVSTARWDVLGTTLDAIIATQLANGEVAFAFPIGYDAILKVGGYTFLQDYVHLGVLSFYHYIQGSGDVDYLKKDWDLWKQTVNFVASRINATDGLAHLRGPFLGGANGGAAASCITVQVLNKATELAEAADDTVSAQTWKNTSATLQQTIRSKLWNGDKSFFALNLDQQDSFSAAGNGLCFIAGVGASEQGSSFVDRALGLLALGPGYKDDTTIDPTNTKISPNTNGFLLEGLAKLGTKSAAIRARALMHTLWGAMLADPKTSSGASWEYVGLDGSPGLSWFTSQSHPWGGAATYVISEYVAGIQPADGVAGFGLKSWVVKPEFGLLMGLRKVNARYPTAFGTLLVTWSVGCSGLDVEIVAPRETEGTFVLGSFTRTLSGSENITLQPTPTLDGNALEDERNTSISNFNDSASAPDPAADPCRRVETL
ncbi:glycoside hydrolase family 78 protein [Gonapodya prolifera JEL478]|uniref:Glycoside hydrolase family 78 protein n=1 Tax=Gonapodya prolifera (strain JEL478) TaxID=1344416 RepID=A0A138ZZU0_GONPJ|nr:glycoside hydrolase family 78 protein [Gonapodya prolifera JEL478]|eukprot:KXS10019.1 glycoside hydrolase family 78 protein [Gonapodya prolifera JEL478]